MKWSNVVASVEIIMATPDGRTPSDSDFRKALIAAAKEGRWIHAGPPQVIVTREGDEHGIISL